MRDPFKIEGPAVISFSGGRTSGMLLWKVLEAHGGTLPDDVRVLFANTGKEMPETLDFVAACSARWGVPITWLEYADDDVPQRRWKEVSFETASRAGEPFDSLIWRKRMLPNPVTRICTAELKIRVMKLYAQQVLGFEHWTVVIGFRADEPVRVARLSAPHREPYDRCAPLASAGITAGDVGEFWQRQDFDLGLPNMGGVTMHGNCDLCFLKPGRQIMSLIRESPSRADWWARQETRVKPSPGRNGHTFRADRPSYSVMADAVARNGELFTVTAWDEPLADCGCTD